MSLMFTGALSVVLFAGPALAGTTTNPANAPTGTHLKTGTPGCSASGTTLTCKGFTLAGVGNTNATATLNATWTALINCRNNGGQVVESHSESIAAPTNSVTVQSKNGNLTVPSLTSTAPSSSVFLAQATCPNPNWTAEVAPGNPTLTSFDYKLTFAGFTNPYIEITPDP